MSKKASIVNQVNATTCEIFLYGKIGRFWEIDTTWLIPYLEDVRKSGVSVFIFYVNTDGGAVPQIQALWNYLNRDDITVTWIIDGMAASSGFLMMTNPKHRIEMRRYSKILIHRVSGWMEGNSEQMRAQADAMDLFENDCIDMIAGRCGKTNEQVKKLWFDNVDHWFNPTQALDLKLCDTMLDGIDDMEEPPTSLQNPTDIYNFYQSHILNQTKTDNTMDHKEIAPLIGMDAGSAESAVKTGIVNLAQKAGTLEKENTTLKAERDNLQSQLDTAKKASVKTLIDSAIAEKKITEADRQEFTDMAMENLDRTTRVLAKMTGVGRVASALGQSAGIPEAEKAWTFDDYHKKGALENLKKTNPERFKALYQQKFNREYTD